MTLLSDWLRKHFGDKPEPAPVSLPPLGSIVSQWDAACMSAIPMLEKLGITMIIARTNERGAPGTVFGTAATPASLEILLDWARDTVRSLPNPVVQ